jgi:hypothetical protein
VYRVVVPKRQLPAEAPGEWLPSRILNAEKILVERTRKGKTKILDLRPFVAKAEIIGESDEEVELLLSLRRTGGSAPRPSDVIRVACGFTGDEEYEWKIARTENLTSQEGLWYTPIDLPKEKKKRKTLTCRR